MPSTKPVITTSVPAFKNPPPAGIYDGNGSFSNAVLASLILGVPWFVKRLIPFVNRGGWKTYLSFVAILGVPVALAYWTLMSVYGSRKNERVLLPGKDLEDYINIRDPALKALYHGKEKIPMQVLYYAYIEQKIDIKGALDYNILTLVRTDTSCFAGDVLEALENRYDFAKMTFTPELFRHVLFKLIPDVIFHTQSQDEEQIRDNYDRASVLFASRLVYTLTWSCA